MMDMSGFCASETHVSWLVFMPDRVYKIKKPVDFPFLNLTDRAARVEACRSEVRLNRRLSPDVYLGVGLFEEPGGATEPVVVMKRLPSEASLAAKIDRDDPDVGACLGSVAKTLAAFHGKAERNRVIDTACTSAAVGHLWDHNLAELKTIAGSWLDTERVDDIHRLALRYLAGRYELFKERIGAGRTVDGHGDLLCDDIFCVEDGPRILDCLEFDDRLRHGDTLYDVASLAVDLEFHSRTDLAENFVQSYREESGDSWPHSLEQHYKAYRAAVRCKVAFLQAKEDGQRCVSAADALLQDASTYLREAAVRLVVIGGLPGTGKTTLASSLSNVTGWSALHSDVLRKELVGLTVGTPAPSSIGTGLYSNEMTTTVYNDMFHRAEHSLSRGESVIIDASFADPVWREAAAELAARTFTDLVPIVCEAPKEVVYKRLAEPRTGGSDATAEVHDWMASSSPPWPGAFVVDTSQSNTEALKVLLDIVNTR